MYIKDILKQSFQKGNCGSNKGAEFSSCLRRLQRESSALLCTLWLCKRRVITCGTHFEETKLVASITGRPAPESMSISWIFTPVGTISWGTMKLKQLFLDLIPLKMGGTICRFVADVVFATMPDKEQ